MKKTQISGAAVEEIRRQLAFIENQAERLRLLFAKNLKADALAEFNALVDKGIYFEHPSRTHGVQLDSAEFSTDQDADSIVCSIDHSCHFTLPGIAKFFGWKKRETQSFIERLLAKVIEIDPISGRKEIASWFGSWEVNAARRVFEKNRPKDKKFAERIERWILLSYFYDGNYFTGYLGDKWYEQWLGLTLPKSYHLYHDDPGALEERIDQNAMKYRALGNRLQQLGMSREEVQEAFFKWIEKYQKGGLDLYWMASVLKSQILPWRGERLPALMREMTDTVLENYMRQPYVAAILAKHGMNTDPAFRNKYIGWLANQLAEGKLAYVYHVNYLVGDAFFGESSRVTDNTVKLEECAALAFDKAVAAGKFGIAAAIALQFGEEKCLNEKLLASRAQGKNDRERKHSLKQLVEERKTQIRESVGIAKAANQPIRLDYACSFLKPC